MEGIDLRVSFNTSNTMAGHNNFSQYQDWWENIQKLFDTLMESPEEKTPEEEEFLSRIAKLLNDKTY